MSELWLDLYGTYSEKYKKARPKRGQYIESYIRRHGLEDLAGSWTFLELGAFSGKDSSYLDQAFPIATCLVSDLEPGILINNGLKLPAFAADVFKLPIAAKAVDLSFHSGLIIYFDDTRVASLIKNQLEVTREYIFVFGLNRYNVVDHIKALYYCFVRGDQLYRYRRFTKTNLTGIAATLQDERWTYMVEYHDSMAMNFACRCDSTILKYIASSRLCHLPFFFNEVVLVMKRK